MTDRIRVLTVILDRDYRDDDIAQLRQAIMTLRGVHDVRAEAVTGEQHIAREVVRGELRREVIDAIFAVFNKDEKSR